MEEFLNIIENAYFLVNTDSSIESLQPRPSFWAEETIMSQMEYDLGIARDRWSSSSRHRITEELEFLTLGSGTVNYARTLTSINSEIAALPDNEPYNLLIIFVVTNPAFNILDNNLNIHYRCIK